MSRQQENNIMGWGIILMVALFIGAMHKATQVQTSNQSQITETK